MNIEEILARRSDLSTFLVHLTRDGVNNESGEPETGRSRLEQILKDKRLIAKNPFGQAIQALTSAGLSTDSQRSVCFTETPLEHTSLLLGPIDNRQCQFDPYGIAITRKQARRVGVNPVWYLDITSGHDWLTTPINKMISDAIKAGNFDNQPISEITPFIEQMGSGKKDDGISYRKEFWWEREWRHVGDILLPRKIIVLCPQYEMREIQNLVDQCRDIFDEPEYDASFIDPRWSLEQIIGHLAGFEHKDLGSF